MGRVGKYGERMIGCDVKDGSRMLNLSVLIGLNAGEIVSGPRRSGKSITLLTHIAVRLPFGPRSKPIVVCESQGGSQILRSMWCASFPDHPEPLWMGYRQFLAADGITGPVYVDEPRYSWNMARIREHAQHCGGLMGGVVSA